MTSQVLVVSEIQYIWTAGSFVVCDSTATALLCHPTCEVMLIFSWLCWQRTQHTQKHCGLKFTYKHGISQSGY